MIDKQTNMMFGEIFKIRSSAWLSRNGFPVKDRTSYMAREIYTHLILEKKLSLKEELIQPVFEEAISKGYIDLIKEIKDKYPLDKEYLRHRTRRAIAESGIFVPANIKEVQDLLCSWLDDSDIDWLCGEFLPHSLSEWNQAKYGRYYLLGKGIATFNRSQQGNWRRRFNVVNIHTEEALDHAIQFGDREFTEDEIEGICKMQGKSGERKFIAFLTWPGFLAGLKKYRKWLIYKPKWSYTIYEFMSNVPALKEEYYGDFFDALQEEADIKAAKDKKLVDKMNKVKEYTIAEFRKKDIELTALQGNDERPGRDRNQFAHWHDDVQYMIYVMGPQEFPTQKAIDEDVHKLVELKKRHHNKIKLLYNHIKEVMGGDIWVMSGGGAQLQAFYGDKDGYIGTLYLDMEYGKEKVDTSFSFTINRQKLDKVLGGYKQFGIKVVTYKEVWGNTEYYKPELENTQE